eukprot:s1467_g4.t1
MNALGSARARARSNAQLFHSVFAIRFGKAIGVHRSPASGRRDALRPTDKLPALAPETPAPQRQLKRQLSFANVTMDQLSNAIREEDPGLEWLDEFWTHVLTKSPPSECKTLSLRSLSNWVTVYNRWQALGGWQPGKAPAVLDASKLQETKIWSHADTNGDNHNVLHLLAEGFRLGEISELLALHVAQEAPASTLTEYTRPGRPAGATALHMLSGAGRDSERLRSRLISILLERRADLEARDVLDFVKLFDPSGFLRAQAARGQSDMKAATRYSVIDTIQARWGAMRSLWALGLLLIGCSVLTVATEVSFDESCITPELEFALENHFVARISPKKDTVLDSSWLTAWMQRNTNCLRHAFVQHGALLFRGFKIEDASAFEAVALAMVPNLEKEYLGTSPRSGIQNTTYVFTAADFQPHRTVPVHIEMSFRDFPPATQLFYAKRVDQWVGGETPLTDMQAVWEKLAEDPELREQFETGELEYLRNMDDCASTSAFDPLVQKCWQMMFKDEKDAKRNCETEGFNCTWDASNRLTLRNRQPFVRKNALSGRAIWYNHINVLHGQMMPGDYFRTATLWPGLARLWPTALWLYYRSLFGIYSLFVPDKDMGSTVLKGSGEAFSSKELKAMKAAIHQHTRNHAYRQHDVVMLDNHRIAHGREIYLGPKESRMIYTAWSNEMSTAISKKQKVRFLLGVFDENDNRFFEMPEFIEMLSSFFHGIACAFGLEAAATPKCSSKQALGRKLFTRILRAAAVRLPPGEGYALLSNASAPFAIMEDWFLGESDDPLAVPFALFLERFAVPGEDDDPEMRFKLSHIAPVDPPMETAASLDSAFLTRSEIGIARDVLDICLQECNFSLDHAQAERAIGKSIEPDLWCTKLAKALHDFDGMRDAGVSKLTLTAFLRKILGLRFELDQIEDLKEALEQSRGVLDGFMSYLALPVLPAELRQDLAADYDYASGNRTPEMLQHKMQLHLQGVRTGSMTARVLAGDIDKESYIAAMCPFDFRLNEGHPAVNEVIASMLKSEVSRQEEVVAQKENSFAPRAAATSCRQRRFLKAKVPDETWDLWNRAFDLLDSEGRDAVTFSSLQKSRLLRLEVGAFLCELIAPSGGPDEESTRPDAFTRREFLLKMLDIHNFRPPEALFVACLSSAPSDR